MCPVNPVRSKGKFCEDSKKRFCLFMKDRSPVIGSSLVLNFKTGHEEQNCDSHLVTMRKEVQMLKTQHGKEGGSRNEKSIDQWQMADADTSFTLSVGVENNPLLDRATISHVFFSVTYNLDRHKMTKERFIAF